MAIDEKEIRAIVQDQLKSMGSGTPTSKGLIKAIVNQAIDANLRKKISTIVVDELAKSGQ